LAVRREELKKIWNWLKKEITDKDIEWLKKYRTVKWKDFSEDNLIMWEGRFTYNVFDLSHTIQDVINAKVNCTNISYYFGGGLPKFFLWEIAKMLNLDVTENNLKWQLANRIIREINRLNEEKREIYSKAPSVTT